jgi:DNA-binding transcriptional LysR family regulator
MDQRSLIDDIPAFLAVARARSFTRAAAQRANTCCAMSARILRRSKQS